MGGHSDNNRVLFAVDKFEDALKGVITFTYDATGNLLTTTTDGDTVATGAPTSITVEMEYNNLGLKEKMIDPDKGTWLYKYNAFGELVEQTNETSKDYTKLQYDFMGRMFEREDFRFVTTNTYERLGYSQWHFDPVRQWQLASVSHESTLMGSTSYIDKTLTYDDYGRPTTVTTQIDQDTKQYLERTTYDQFGRVFQQFDASGHSRGNRAVYNGAGYLSEVRDAGIVNGSQQLYLRVKEIDAAGRVTEELLGNGLTTTRTYEPDTGYLKNITTDLFGVYTAQNLNMVYDPLGNLQQRENRQQLDNNGDHLIEYFCYDDLYRLTATNKTGCSASDSDYEYDSYGNIMVKKGLAGNYEYAGNEAGPHAVTKAGGKEYRYDHNGNMVRDLINGVTDRTLSYTLFDKPYHLTKGNDVTEFRYGADRSRYKRVDSIDNRTTTTRYIGNVEFVSGPEGLTVKRYINGQVLVTETHTADDTVTNRDISYLLKDHLGSVTMVVGQVIGENSTSDQRMSFDAWGKRRNTTSLNDLIQVEWETLDRTTTRGYTGHEMVDSMGLIHANGRVYDPHLGRFLSADSFIQAPNFTQSYNRYSYVVNNPLKYTDPSGHFFGFVFADFISGLVLSYAFTEIMISFDIPILSQAMSIVSCIEFNLGGCVGASVGSTFAATGDLGASLKSGTLTYLQAGVFGDIGELADGPKIESMGFVHIGLHAAAGGVFSVLQGGKFGHGFISAGVTKMFTDVQLNAHDGAGGGAAGKFAGSMVAALVGGTVSEATGGKFANGAMTGAMQFLFNAASDKKKKAGGLSNCAAPVCEAYRALYKSYFGEKAQASDFTSDATDGMMSSYRAPKQAELAVVLTVGFQPQNYPGDGVYLTVNALEAGKYANSYNAGVLVVSTPVSTFEQLFSGGHIMPDGLVPGAFNVLPSGIQQFNRDSIITHVPPGSYELFDQFGAQ